MPTLTEEQESHAISTDEPDIKWILSEFRKSGQDGNYWARVSSAEDTRLNRWDSQDDSGKKLDVNMPNGETAFPFNGANDARVYLADGVINENVAIKTSAFWRSELQVQAVNPNSISDSSTAKTFCLWLRDSKLRRQLMEEVEHVAARHTTI